MAIKIEVKNLYKIFGENPDRSFKYIEKGESNRDYSGENRIISGRQERQSGH